MSSERKPGESPPRSSRRVAVRLALFVLLVIAVVSLPFVLLGEAFAEPLLAAQEHRTVWLVAIAIVLLAADSVAPVPSVVVIIFLAAKAGVAAGIVGGTIGLTAGVVLAWWFGRAAVGRLAPRFFPDDDLARLRDGMQRRLPFTIACWRSVPVMAETSVIVAAAVGVPLRRVVTVSVVPNLAIAVIYSFATAESWWAAVLAVLSTIALSLVLWHWRE